MLLASKSAKDDNRKDKDNCALHIDEMIITNGMVYSVAQQKVYGLAELLCHAVKNEI
jgi:hypothetical protein